MSIQKESNLSSKKALYSKKKLRKDYFCQNNVHSTKSAEKHHLKLC